MSYALETLNKGKEEVFGFLGPDVTCIRLGDLEPMNLSQFCTHATNTLIISLEGANQSEREQIAEIVDHAVSRTAGVRVRSLGRKGELPESHQTFTELIGDMKAAEQTGDYYRLDRLNDELTAAFGKKTTDYPENPFKIEGSQINIGDKYQVDLEEFAHFTMHILAGGYFGWCDYGMPQETHDSLEKLAQSVKIMA